MTFREFYSNIRIEARFEAREALARMEDRFTFDDLKQSMPRPYRYFGSVIRQTLFEALSQDRLCAQHEAPLVAYSAEGHLAVTQAAHVIYQRVLGDPAYVA